MNRASRRAAKANVRTNHGAGVPPEFVDGVAHLQAGRLMDAEAAYLSAVRRAPRHAASRHHLGLVAFKMGRRDDAVGHIRASLEIDPSDAKAWLNLAVILSDLRRPNDALAACRNCISRDGASAEAHKVLGDILRSMGDIDGAVAAYAAGARVDPKRSDIRLRSARLLAERGRAGEALVLCDEALAHDASCAEAKVLKLEIVAATQESDPLAVLKTFGSAPALADAERINGLGRMLRARGRHRESISAFELAIRAERTNPRWHFDLATSFDLLGEPSRAFEACKTALDLDPSNALGYVQLGLILRKMEMQEGAITAFSHAVSLDESLADAHHNLATTLKLIGRLEDAKAAFERAIALESASLLTRFELCHIRRSLCDWEGLEAEEAACLEAFRASDDVVPAFGLFSMPAATAADQLESGRRYALKHAVPVEQRYTSYALDLGSNAKIRIGYLSNDFCNHATSLLLAEVIELHDRTKFDVAAYCYSPEDGSALRRRMMSAFDRFIDIRAMPHAEAAQRIHDDRIDILIDLKGYTRDSRPEIVSFRPAPLQVNYLGYPATMGADFVDYLIADKSVAPHANGGDFSERIVHLEASYQPNDRARIIAPETPSRAAAGLPDDAFVFCAFNGSWKINAGMFDVWMRLLNRVPGSVLWLLEPNAAVAGNLRRESQARGVDPARLVFAPKLANDQHLARHRLADLFLDCVPCNAHTTASDALWAGLPVLTIQGETFAARVASSLVEAVGQADLVCRTLDEYEQRAVALVQNRDVLDALKAALHRNRMTAPLFDTVRYTRSLEAAYERMIALRRSGSPPQPFSV